MMQKSDSLTNLQALFLGYNRIDRPKCSRIFFHQNFTPFESVNSLMKLSIHS
jgi:hypothetical protein